jgi:hypothetical protein
MMSRLPVDSFARRGLRLAGAKWSQQCWRCECKCGGGWECECGGGWECECGGKWRRENERIGGRRGGREGVAAGDRVGASRHRAFCAGCQPGVWGLDYAALFSDDFAKYYGFLDPNAPGHYLNLCQLVVSGKIHELWLVGSGDVPDANAAEVLESKQRYDAARNPLPGVFEKCAGNGCFDDDVPHCARSLRIGFVNYDRGPGCYLHSQGHALEATARQGGAAAQ